MKRHKPKPTTGNQTPAAPARITGRGYARRSRRLVCAILGLLAICLAAAGYFMVLGGGKKTPLPKPPETNSFPLPPLSDSPFLNTKPEAHDVGSEACQACHVGHAAGFHRSPMGRSMAEVDLKREPPDAVFDHPASKRRYQVVRKDGQLWHRELLLAGQSEEVVLAEYPLKYVVGSGHHSLTYLVEAEGFLVESPLTWYTSKKGWAMSPGYDRPDHYGFELPIDEGCLLCHAGRFATLGGSPQRIRVGEAAIGCEQCHGPGSLHVERHQARDRSAEKDSQPIDYTIVNPTHLSRPLAEAICQQCHLRSNATVIARGRKPLEYRPGLPLEDFRHDYRLEAPNTPMTVVGHVEQMHLSRCYQSSGTFSCLTCHNPHGEPRANQRVDYYNSICLSCHQPHACIVPAARRQQESPENNCIHCHMPQSPTDIPHLAFTHHRVGKHEKPTAVKTDTVSPGAGVLVPFQYLSRLSEIERKRSLGIGYLETANRQRAGGTSAVYCRQAFELLTQVRAAGLRDPSVDVSLARLRFDMRLGDAAPDAEKALADRELTGQERCTALFLLADSHASQGRAAEAIAALRQLVQLRRHSTDWLLFADCEQKLGNQQGAIQALEMAVRINPRLWKVHKHLAEHYRAQGNLERASWHERRAVPLD